MGDDEWIKLPTEEKVLHKVWKARVAGYEEAMQMFARARDDKAPEFGRYLGLLKKFVVDNNIVAQEKGLDAVLSFLENAHHTLSAKTVGEVISGIVAKCLNARARTKEKGQEVIMIYIELEKHELVMEELIKGLANKQPKIVTACLETIKMAVRGFGSKTFQLKPVVKLIPSLLEDRDKDVREQTKQLTVEVYRWIGGAVKPQLANIKPVQLTELEAEFEKVATQRPRQTRFLRSQQDLKAKMEEQQATGGEEDETDAGSSGPAEEVDPYDFMDPVEILMKLPKDFYDKCEAKKWQLRKEAMEVLQPLTANMKLEAGDYGDLVRALKKIIAKDTNVMVVAAAAKCLAGLAAGLRKKFSPYAGQCVPTLLEKFKEKKPMVVTALREAIDAIYLTTTLDSVSEDVIASMESKSPSVKVETALFLSRCFVRCTLATLPKKVLKPLVAPMIKAINEPDPNVRDASAECLGTALKVVGEKGMGPFIAEVDKLKQDKIKECCEKAVLLNANGQPRGGATSSSATSAPAKKVTIQEPPPAAAVKKPAPGKRPAPTKKKPPASRAKKAGGKPPPAEKPDIVEREMSVEEIEEKAAEILPAQVLPGLASSNWKERLAAMEAFTETVKRTENWDAACQVCVGVLCVRKPGLRDSNFQVEKLKLELLALLAASGRFSRRSVDLALHDAVDRVSDGKSGAAAGTALTAMAEATSLGYLAENVVGYAFTQKNPKNQAESLNWLAQAIKEFGFQGVNAKAIKDSVKKALAAINPAVRQAGITLLGVMYMYVGPPLRVLFEDEKAALLQQIDAEIEKVRDTPAPQPTRGVAAARAGSAAESDEREEEDEDGGGEGGIGIQDMVTRTDVSAQLTPVLLEQMSDKNWKVRCEALSSLKLIITEAKYITGNLAELPSALKPRLTESNKMLQMTTLGIVQAMGGALGPHCKQHIRTVGPSIITCMGDAKPQVRQTAVATLNAWVDHTGILPLLEGEGLTDLIKTENPFLRSELLTWLAPKLEVTKKVPAADLRESLPYLYTCLEDRNADVRKAANDTLVPFMIHVGYPRMTEAASKLKPSSRTQVMGILEKAREKLPAKAPPPPKKAASSAKLKLEEAAPPPHKSASAPMLETMDQQKVIWDEDDDAAADSKPSTKGKPKPGKGKAPPSAKSKKPADEEFGPTLVNNDSKRQRLRDEEKLKVLKWNFTQPRQEFVDQLKEQMQNNVSTPLLTQMFHADFKHHIKAIDALCEAITTSEDATVAQLDLVLKWLTLRFFDTNPSVLLRGLDYLGSLFTALSQRGYNLPDAEAISFIPYLVMKAGDPKDPVRKVVKNILRLVYKVYPASKMFTYIIDGLKSKNARQRTECLDELGYLIEVFGINVCQPSVGAALKLIAQQIGDRDNGVRNAALNTAVQAYLIVGDNVHRYVGQLADKDQSLLDERIKRSAKNRAACATRQAEPEDKQAKAASKNAGAADQRLQAAEAPPVRPRSLILDLEESMSESDCSGKARLIDIPDLEDEPIHLPVTRGRAPSPAMKVLHQSTDTQSTLDLVVSQIASKDIRTSIHALAQIDELLKDGEKCNLLAGHADQLVLVSSLQLRLTYSKYMQECAGEVITIYRCLMATLIAFFKTKNLAKGVTKEILRDLVHNLITILLDKRLMDLEDGPQVIRSVNVMVVKILEYADTTCIMGALLKLLQECIGNDTCSSKFTELIMKCLWKMIRMLPNVINTVDLDHLLLDLHHFMQAFPPSSWKDKNNDTPLRTVKTILHSLAKLKGNEIVTHLKLIENAEESEISQYLQKVLRTGFSVKPTTNNNNNTNAHVNGVTENSKDKAEKSTRRLSKSCHDMLAEIFKKIGSKENTKEGLSDLYDFKLTYPDADIEPFLCKSSQFFQSYIERGLRDIERARQSKPGSKPSGGGSAGGPSAMAAASELENLSAFDYMEKLKALRARCGHTEAAGVAKKEALGNSAANKENRKSPAEGGMNMISQKAGEAEEASGDRESPGSNAGAGSSGGAGSATETNTAEVLDLKKRLEKIKTGAIKTE